MPKETQKAMQQEKQHEVFEQVADERGRLRLDRPATASEALEQDAANREAFGRDRLRRFEPPLVDKTDDERREARRQRF